MALLDMGAEYHCYAADITCSFPVVSRPVGQADRSTAFSPDQRLVYEAVLGAQRAVIAALQPGASWLELHRTAERTILRSLLGGGVLTRGDGAGEGHCVGGDVEAHEDGTEASIDEMLAADLGAVVPTPSSLPHPPPPPPPCHPAAQAAIASARPSSRPHADLPMLTYPC